MKLTKETIIEITNEFWRRNYSDCDEDLEVLLEVLAELDFTFVAGDNSHSLLESRQYNDRYGPKNRNKRGKQS